MGVGVRKKTYLVDVHWDVAKTYEVDAISRDAAEDAVRLQVSLGNFTPRDCEATDDIDIDVRCVGTLGKDKNGKPVHNYFE